MVKIRILPPTPILKDFHRDYRSALLMDNFKIIYRYDKERDEIVIGDIWYTKRSQQTLLRQFKSKLTMSVHYD